MIYFAHQPGLPLAGFVESIVFFEGYQPEHQREVLIPDGSAFLVIDLTDKAKRLYAAPFSAHFTEFRQGWLSGLQQKPITIEAQQNSSFLVVKFVPGAVSMALQLPATALTDQIIELDGLLGAESNLLRQGVVNGVDAEAKVSFAQDWLLKKIGESRMTDPILGAMTKLLTDDPLMGVSQLAEAVGYSERHTRSLFLAGMGVNPKQFVRILRFQSLLKHLAASGGADAVDTELVRGSIPTPVWADVALRFGYSDQAHMIAEFRKLSGFTPRGYVDAYRGMVNFLPIKVPVPI